MSIQPKMKFKSVMPKEDDAETLAAKHELWRMGDLSWKLKGKQIELYESNIDQSQEISVNLCARRFGKSFVNLVTALEVMISTPYSIVKYACPTQKMVKDVIIPLLRIILIDAPPEFEFSKIWSSDNKLTLPNGAMLSIAGTDNGNADNLRGAYAHLIIVDEAGFMDDLKYAVQTVLLPQLDTVNGKLLMTSTPNFYNPQHDFHTLYINPQEASGKLKKFTIYDSPLLDEQKIEEIVNRTIKGVDDPVFRCEYLVEIPKNVEASVVPEFYQNRENIIVEEMKLPAFVDTYVSGDIGVRDLTVYLFGYYDFMTATLYIMDEWVMNGMDMTTNVVAESIKAKEEKHFTDDNGFYRVPLRRVMDNNLNMIIDLNKLHGLNFMATKKDNKAAAINNLRILIQEDRLKIHSRCKHLIYHTENAIWKSGNGTGKEFDHLTDSVDGTIRGGHADACFVPGTRVLTKNGYLKIEDITPGTEVLTHKGRFRRVKHNMNKEYCGDIFEIKTKGKNTTIKSTIDHKYFVTDFKKTKTNAMIPANSQFETLSENMKNKKLFEPYIPAKNEYKLSKEMCFLYGYWVAEGCISKNKSQVKFAGHQKETNVVDIIAKAITEHYPTTAGKSKESLRRHKLGLNKPMTSTVRIINDTKSLGRNIVVGKKQLWKDLEHLGKSDFKKFPDFIGQLNREQSLYMLAGYLYGDGSFSLKVKWSSISLSVMDGVEILMKKLGYNPSNESIKKSGIAIFNNKTYKTKDKYLGYLTGKQGTKLLREILNFPDLSHIYKQKSQNLIKITDKFQYTNEYSSNEYIDISKIEKQEYNGKVYNLEVEEDESYCVEGIAVHNCDALIYMVRNLSLHHNPYPDNITRVTENQQQRITTVEDNSSTTSFIKKLLGRKR